MPSSTFPDLILLEKEFALFRLPAQSSIPPQILVQLTGTGTSNSCSFVSVTRTPEEVSIVTDQIPADLDVQDSLWRCIKINGEYHTQSCDPFNQSVDTDCQFAGPLTHDLTGILNNLSTPLKEAEVPIFAVSTWCVVCVFGGISIDSTLCRDTDYVLVPKNKVEEAVNALLSSGWKFLSM